MKHGNVTHFEIPIKDEEKASEFYKEIFNWKVMKWPEGEYWMTQTGETDEQGMTQEKGFINGGFTKDTDVSVIVINVDSIDETLEKIKENDGSVNMEKRKVGDMGFYARFKDPEGNIVGLWENA